jgi:hypothetical protein
MKRVVEPGAFTVFAGPDSTNLKKASFRVVRPGEGQAAQARPANAQPATP